MRDAGFARLAVPQHCAAQRLLGGVTRCQFPIVAARGQFNRTTREFLRLPPLSRKSCRAGLPVERDVFIRPALRPGELLLHARYVCVDESEFIESRVQRSHFELELQRLRERVFGFGKTIETNERPRQFLVRRSEIAIEADGLIKRGQRQLRLTEKIIAHSQIILGWWGTRHHLSTC